MPHVAFNLNVKFTAPSSAKKRRVLAVAVLFAIAAGLAAGLGQTVSSCAGPGRAKARPLTTAEAKRLAAMRVQNYRDARTGLRAHIGKPGAEVRVSGWVDWSRPLAYLAVAGPGARPADTGLVQAMPGIIATRAGKVAAMPPAVPPDDGWRVRALSDAGGVRAPLDTFIGLLFVVAAKRPDTADVLARSDARWLGTDRTDGVSVDILLGPALPPAPPVVGPVAPEPSASTYGGHTLASMGGPVKYWLDRDSQMHRLEALLGNNVPVRVDFERDEQPELPAIAALGGAPIKPRAVTVAEAKILAGMRLRNRTSGGGKVRIAGVGRAEGWLDWRTVIVYLALSDVDKPSDDRLVVADGTGRATRPATKMKDGLPPVPVPTKQWKFESWAQRGDKLGGYDFDLLIGEGLALTSAARDDAGILAKSAVWLRSDVVGKTPVTVYEVPKPEEKGVPKGGARMRYWVDKSGLLRRLELRTRTGGLAQLDITPGAVPKLAKNR